MESLQVVLPLTPQRHKTPERRAKKERVAQPLELINVDNALLHLGTLEALAGESISTLYRAARRGELVLTKLGRSCTRVRAQDARAYLQRLAGGAQ
jgi:hypothetical protein